MRVKRVLARRVQAGDKLVRSLPEGSSSAREPFDIVRDVRWIEAPHLEGVAVVVQTERFPDGLHYGRKGRARVLYED